MKTLSQLCLFTVLALFAVNSIAGEISEAQVKKLIAQMDVAIDVKSVEGIAATLSDTVIVDISIHAGGKLLQKMQMSKQEYITMLKQGWDMTSSYSYVRSNEQISISGNAATVTATVVEVATMQGQTIKTTTEETAIIELVNDAPLVTRISGSAHM